MPETETRDALGDLARFEGHTPGPWCVVPYGDGDTLVVCTDAGGNWRICFMATPGETRGASAKIAADARLIAAAPSLLAEVRRLREALKELRLTARILYQNSIACGVQHHGRALDAPSPGWLVDCDKVIAKAEALIAREASNG